MTDYSKLSDDELLKAAGMAPTKDYSKLSDDELLGLAGLPAKPKDTSFTKGLAYGAENAIRGLSATSKFLGAPKRSAADQLADVIHTGAGLDNYAPAGAVVGDSSKGVGERLMSAPRALVEGAPGLATDLVAGAVAGPAGFLASNSYRNLGNNVEAAKGDLTKALGVTAADAILSRFGAKATVGSTPMTVGKAALTDAGVGAAQTVLDKDILTGEKSTPGDIAVNAITGAGVGVAGRAADAAVNMPKTPAAIKDARIRPVTDALDQNSVARVSDALKQARESKSPDDYNYAFKHFDNKVTAAMTDPFFKAQLKEDPKVGHAVVTAVKDFNGRLRDGQELTDSDLERLDAIIGNTDEGKAVVSALKDRNTVNQLGTLYGTGLSQSKLAEALDPNKPGFNPIRTVDYHTLWRALRGQGIGLPELAVGTAQWLAKPITKGIDSLTGASDPSKVLIERFAGKDSPEPSVGSYGDTLAAQAATKVQAKLDAVAAKQQAKDEALAAKAQAKAETLAAKEKTKANAESLKRVVDQVKALKIDYLPQSQRFGRDMAEPASLPEGPQYGGSSPVDPKQLAFNAQLAKKFGVKDLSLINQFDNADPLMDPSQVPANDPMRAQLQHFIRKQQEAKAENEYIRREMETEKAMQALGIDTSKLATPDAPAIPPRPDMTGAFPEPNLVRPEMPPMAEAPEASPFLSLIDQATKRSAKGSAKKAPIEEAMASPRIEASVSPMGSAIREVNPDVYRVKTKAGDVVHASEDTYSSEGARASKTRFYSDARAATLDALVPKLSNNGKHVFNQNIADWNDLILGKNNREAAMNLIDEEILPNFSKEDRKIIKTHLATYRPDVKQGRKTVKGPAFANTWVHKDAEAVARAKAANRKAKQAAAKMEEDE